MPQPRPPRRALLRAGLAGAGSLVLLGCSGERIRTPWEPSPTVDATEAARRVPDGDLLLAARDRVAGYRVELSRTVPGSSSQRRRVSVLESLWSTQQERLEQLLAALGVDAPEAPTPQPGPTGEDAARATATDDAAATAGDDAAATTSPSGPEPAVVGALLTGDLETVLQELTRSSSTHRALLVSLAAQHLESARLLGSEVDWPPLAGPVGAAAVPVLARTRPAIFGLEVVSARSLEEERSRYERVLGPVRSATRALTTLAGQAAPVPPLGYDLPEPLDDEEDRLQLAQQLVHDIAPATLSVADRAGSDLEQLRSVLRIVTETERWARDLSVPPLPFPGMTLP